LDEQGYSMRQIVTDALLVFDGINSGYPKMLGVDEIKRTLSEVNDLLYRIGEKNQLFQEIENDQGNSVYLTDAFSTLDKSASKPGNILD
jgi:hypothetical protein